MSKRSFLLCLGLIAFLLAVFSPRFALSLALLATLLLVWSRVSTRIPRVSRFADGHSSLRSKNLEMVMELAHRQERITNNDVEDMLGVSDATASRYLSQLKKKGALLQEGEGRGTYYRLP